MEIVLGILAIAALLLGIVEGGLRLLGFGNPSLYIADEEIGYLLAPNQQVRRLGNRIAINQYSMRSPAISRDCPPSTRRILLLGDSVANGAWWTDQSQTLSALMQAGLQSQEVERKVEVLNASANSWSPRNQLAYLKRFGLFASQGVVLLINTDDLFGTAPTSLQVGRDRNYPDARPPLALVELFERYVLPAQPVPGMAEVLAEGGDRVGFNLDAIGEMQAIATQSQAQFYLAMTPLLRELSDSGPREYEIRARQRLQEFVETRAIPYLDFLPIFKNAEQPQSLYRDRIHLSPQGNATVSMGLEELIDR